MESKIEKLLMRRAELLRQIKALKADSGAKHCLVAYSTSIHSVTLSSISNVIADTCIERIYKEWRECNENPYDQCSYDEVFENSNAEPCQHCKDVRQNKKQRMDLRREFGRVNAQITKIGNRLLDGKS